MDAGYGGNDNSGGGGDNYGSGGMAGRGGAGNFTGGPGGGGEDGNYGQNNKVSWILLCVDVMLTVEVLQGSGGGGMLGKLADKVKDKF